MKLDSERPWIVKAIGPLTSKQVDANKEDEREAFFMERCKEAIGLVLKAGKVHLPREDYVGRRVKTVEDLKRIQAEHDAEEVKQRAKAEAKQQRYLAKFAKEAQLRAKDRKEKERRQQLQELQAIRQMKSSKDKQTKLHKLLGVDADNPPASRGSNDDDEFDVEPEAAEAADARKKTRPKFQKPTVSKNRQYRNEKFGHGGPKSGKKRNTEESLNDDSSFSTRRNKQPLGGGVKKAANNRPGKQRRQQLRQTKQQNMKSKKRTRS
jgi:rRNA-processing protein EBP2